MRCLLILTVMAACSGDKPAEIDANPAGPLCTKATYDPCLTEHDCTTAICHDFMAEGFMVCTQGCDASNPCPADSSGNPGTCNTIGICKPAAPTMCHL